MVPLLYSLAAYGVMLAHLLFVATVLSGGLIALKYPWFFRVHVPVFLYAVTIEAVRFQCPLTTFEKFLLAHSNRPVYDRGFLGYYVEPYVSGAGVPEIVYAHMGYWTVGLNMLLYVWVVRRYLAHRRTYTPTTCHPSAKP